MVHTASHTICTHGYHLIHIETAKIFFESLVINLTSIVCHFGLHRLIPELRESLFTQIEMADGL